MRYQISPLGSIDFGATGFKAKLQNASFLLATKTGTCFMDRQAGWETNVDQISDVAKANMTAQIIELIESNIPGLTVEEVNFDEDFDSGTLYPIVKVVFQDDEV